jgi:signal transduction histidine kinase
VGSIALRAISGQSDAAEAARAVVRFWREDGPVAIEVIDADPASIPKGGYGTALRGVADRPGALDGEVAVENRPGAETTVRVRSGSLHSMQV